jgi:hypothetical protein
MNLKINALIVLCVFFIGKHWAQEKVSSTVISNESSSKPVFIDTGNPESDAKRYKEAKNNWITNNRNEYINLSAGKANESIIEQELVKNVRSVDELPGFPSRINTGNIEQDELNYKQAKDIWYQDNRQLVELFYLENAKRQPKTIKPIE